jgi:hypothetical protein
VTLTGKNYYLWARQTTFGLIGCDKFKLVNGERPAPIPKKIKRTNRRGKKLSKSGEEMTTRCIVGWLTLWNQAYQSHVITELNTSNVGEGQVSSARREIMHTFISCKKRFNNLSNHVNQSPKFIANFRRKKRTSSSS